MEMVKSDIMNQIKKCKTKRVKKRYNGSGVMSFS